MDLHHTAVKEETGFSAVEMLLCLIAVTLITFVGYYVYHTQQAANKTYNDATAAAQIAAPKVTKKPVSAINATNTSKAKYLTISEWGVQFAFDPTADPYYVFHKSGTKSTDGNITYADDTVDIGSKHYDSLKNSDGQICSTVDDNTAKATPNPNSRRMVQIIKSASSTEPTQYSEGSIVISGSKYTYFKASHYRPGCSQTNSGGQDLIIANADMSITDQLVKDVANLRAAQN